jgi:hypothetical protein
MLGPFIKKSIGEAANGIMIRAARAVTSELVETRKKSGVNSPLSIKFLPRLDTVIKIKLPVMIEAFIESIVLKSIVPILTQFVYLFCDLKSRMPAARGGTDNVTIIDEIKVSPIERGTINPESKRIPIPMKTADPIITAFVPADPKLIDVYNEK